MTSKVIYLKNLRTSALHLQSGSEIVTDAPTDNNGNGEHFSPTDLVSSALASCMLTIMGISANTHNICIDGTAAEVDKVMAAQPRRIAKIKIVIKPKGQPSYSEKEKSLLEQAAKTCPVSLSLHPETIQEILFIWP